MTVLAMTLPLARASLIRTPRRDVVTDRGEDLTLRLAVVEDDTPDAGPVDLTGAAVQLLLWAAPSWRDYGLPYLAGRRALHTLTGTITDAAGGLAALTLPRDAGALWPLRMGYTLQIDLGGARTTLGWGSLQMPRVYA